jgi:ribonuclease BN (tRNA processing enzyme)
MQVKILGGHGGVSLGKRSTSFLIDEVLLIDAGSCASGLEVEDQKKIDNVLISHPHLDHTKDLGFMCDNIFGLRQSPFDVYCTQLGRDAIKNHLFNELIWPDFSILPTPENPTCRFHTYDPGVEMKLGAYTIKPIRVNHPTMGCGFIISKGDKTLVFTQDTHATKEIWEEAKKYENLKGIFTEVSFPNFLQAVGDVSYHHTPRTIAKEYVKMPPDVPIYLTHLKPNYEKQLITEVAELGIERFHVLNEDGVILHF